MRKRHIIAATSLLFLALTTDVFAASPRVTAASAVVASRDNVVLWSKNPGYKCPPASTTKVMTAIVVLEKLKLDAWATVSAKAERTEPTRVGIRRGEQFRVKDLLYALLMNSGNDVAVCLAEAAAGSEWHFAQMMTQRARKIGAKHTTFKTASGLPAKGQLTTALDLVSIMNRAMKHKIVLQALGTRSKSIYSRTGREVTLRNHNRLLWDRRHAVVLKTGYTRASKHCYVGFLGKDGRDGVFAFLRARKPWDDTRAISSFASRGGARVAFNRRQLSSSTTLMLQQALKRRGFDPGPIDGIFGRKTLMALERYQKAAKLTADGLAGKKTLTKLGLP